MNSLMDFENLIKELALKIDSERDSKVLEDALADRHNWFVSLKEDEMHQLYNEYTQSNARLTEFLSDLHSEMKSIILNSSDNHKHRQKYRLYE